MDPLSMLGTQFALFVCLIIGYYLGKKNKITSQGRAELTDLVLNVMLPASIIGSFMDQKLTAELLRQSETVLIATLVLQFGSAFGGYLLFPRSRFPEEDRKIFRYSLINTNASFVALPVLNTLLGSLGSMLTSVALIPIRISLWTVGLAIFIEEKDLGKKIKAVALNPNMIAVYIGLVLMLLPVSYPAFIRRTFSIVGNGTTFISMMIVGIAVSKVDLKHVVHPSVLYYCLLRLIVIPGIMMAVMKLLGADATATAVSVVIAAVPAGSFTAMMAAKYHSNETLAGQVVLLSTVLSVITLPLLSVFL